MAGDVPLTMKRKEKIMRHKKIVSRLCLLLALTMFSVSGCVKNPFTLQDSYEDYYQEEKKAEKEEIRGMADDLAVVDREEQNTPGYQSGDYADLLINDSTNEIITSYRCFEKVYPASITKIMTALLVLEKGDLDEEIVLDHDIVLTEDGAVVSTLSKGDTVTVDEVFHGMLVKSANDCAVILAEYIAGSEEAFVEMMNERAKELGATHTHFMNPHGLHDDEHYTTAYDLYLIFNAVTRYDAFMDTVSLKDYTMTYTKPDGREVSEYMQSTNYYLLNTYPVPEGVAMYGGKTGTTSMAKSCLIVMTENNDGEKFFSVVLGAETKEDLYNSMSQLLEKVVKQ